jgi:hypothetical protein
MSVAGDVMGVMETFTLVPRGSFSLASSIRFLEGFTPAAYTAPQDAALELAFPVEGSWQTAGVRVRQDGDEVTAVVVSPESPGPELMTAVHAQVERILSLDVDGSGFPAVGERDPVVGRLQQRYPGLRPVGFWSPYEAAAWTIIGHRIRIRQAAAIKARMAGQLGEPVVFEWPERWRTPTGCPGRPRPSRSPRSARTGGRTAPGSPCSCGPSRKTRRPRRYDGVSTWLRLGFR